MDNYDVFGVENALMDIQAFIPEKLLKKLKISKGVMHLIEEDQAREILNNLSEYKINSFPGGSCANTMSAIAMLGGKSVFTGVVSDDMYGRLYESKLSGRGVKTIFKRLKTGLTGTSIILTTEDAERTMNTHLGVSREFYKEDIDNNVLSKAKVFYTTGYTWDTANQKEAIETSMKNAKSMGLEVSFDIADPFCTERNIDDFKVIISKYVDILFGNREEVKILTGLSDPIEAGRALRKMGAKIVCVKVGGEGSYLFTEDKEIKIDVYKADKVLDSTGCGDSYSGGFLYGYTKGYTLTQCGKIASYLASRIVGVPAVQYEMLDFNEITNFIDKNILT